MKFCFHPPIIEQTQITLSFRRNHEGHGLQRTHPSLICLEVGSCPIFRQEGRASHPGETVRKLHFMQKRTCLICVGVLLGLIFTRQIYKWKQNFHLTEATLGCLCSALFPGTCFPKLYVHPFPGTCPTRKTHGLSFTRTSGFHHR